MTEETRIFYPFPINLTVATSELPNHFVLGLIQCGQNSIHCKGMKLVSATA